MKTVLNLNIILYKIHWIWDYVPWGELLIYNNEKSNLP